MDAAVSVIRKEDNSIGMPVSTRASLMSGIDLGCSETNISRARAHKIA